MSKNINFTDVNPISKKEQASIYKKILAVLLAFAILKILNVFGDDKYTIPQKHQHQQLLSLYHIDKE